MKERSIKSSIPSVVDEGKWKIEVEVFMRVAEKKKKQKKEQLPWQKVAAAAAELLPWPTIKGRGRESELRCIQKERKKEGIEM